MFFYGCHILEENFSLLRFKKKKKKKLLVNTRFQP